MSIANPTSRRFYDPDEAHFCSQPASVQNAVDLASGNWVTDFSDLGLAGTGPSKLYPDHRIAWLRENYGSLESHSVLELGSLEGAHTIQFAESGAQEVVGLEANEAHFMKALLVRNQRPNLNIQFLLGDFQGFLEACQRRFDLVSAAGVLYHMTNPMQTVAAASKLSDALFIWTVVYNDALIPDGHKNLISGQVDLEASGFRYQGFKHHYRSIDASRARKDKNFSGGLDDHAIWLEPDVLIDGLRHFGYADITSRLAENKRHGQNILLVARR